MRPRRRQRQLFAPWCAGWRLLFLVSNKPAEVEPKPATAAAPALPSWGAGKRYGYATELRSKLVLSGQALMGFDLKAKLTLQAQHVGAETQLIAQIAQPTFKAETPETQAQFASLSRELEEPFGFAVADGKLSSLYLPANWSPFATSIARTLAAAFQLATPAANQKGSTWSAKEVDATGQYDVEYAPVNGDATLLSKHKVRYASLSLGKLGLGQFGAKVVPEVLESKGTIKLGKGSDGPQLTAIDYREKLKVQLTGASLVDSETSLRSTYEGLSPVASPSDFATILANTRRLAPDEVPTTRTPSTNYDAQRIGDYTFETALRDLELQAKDPRRNQLLETVRDEPFAPADLKEREAKLQQQGRAFSALAALLRTDKKNVPLAVARVRSRSPALRGLLDALASAGTPEAQSALVSLLDDGKLDMSLRRAAASGLARTEHATPETVRALQAHVAPADPLHVFALYGLGTIARRLRDAGDTERAGAVVRGLVADLARVSTPADQVDVLRALANSGGAEALEAVRPYLTAGAVKVRIAAVDALRLMQLPEVDGIIIDRLGQAEPEMRNAALDAVSVRTPSAALVAALQQAAQSDTKPALRLKAVRIMAQWLPQRPELRSSLERLASSDESEQIRKAARTGLGS